MLSEQRGYQGRLTKQKKDFGLFLSLLLFPLLLLRQSAESLEPGRRDRRLKRYRLYCIFKSTEESYEAWALQSTETEQAELA